MDSRKGNRRLRTRVMDRLSRVSATLILVINVQRHRLSAQRLQNLVRGVSIPRSALMMLNALQGVIHTGDTGISMVT